MSRPRIYLNHGATTPVAPEVVDAMSPFFSDAFGNPSAGDTPAGKRAHEACELGRTQVAHSIGAAPEELIFTSGATESNNLAIIGTAREARRRNGRTRLVTSTIEHKAVLSPMAALEREGFELVHIPATGSGVVDLAAARELITSDTVLVSVQLANNELGTIQPVRDIAELAHARGALMHTDAAQALAKIPLDVRELDVDLLSLSAHKAYGPKGIGGLFLRNGARGFPIQPIAFGGDQEAGLRPGTLNTPGIVGFAEACNLASKKLASDMSAIASVRDAFENQLKALWPAVHFNGDSVARVAGASSATFRGLDADALLALAPTIDASTSSACTSGAPEPSHVLQAIGLDRHAAYGTVRLMFGRSSTRAQAVEAAAELADAAAELSRA
jgi:cysteine desulfurase